MSIRAKTALAHDHAMLFTKYQIQTQKSESKVGYANVAAMCTDRSVSLVEDSMYIYTANTIAHELIHSLGANHDGDGNMCSAAEGLMMAPNRVSTQDVHNEWLFSSCTVDYIKHYINQLDGRNSNCLRVDNNPRPFLQDIEYSKHMYGSVYGADEQCQIKYGPHSYVCRSFYNVTYSKLCSHMNCFDPKDLLCHGMNAGEGTQCGDQKWCILGTCVHDQNAKRGLESCPLGDQPGVAEQGLTCAELISRSPQKCYLDYFHTICCGSCSRIKGALLGLNKTVDEQCVEENGHGSFFCRGADAYKDRPYGDTICTSMLCADPHRDKWCIATIPADGTPCGYMKVCKQQMCVHYDSAPPVPETCLYGDNPGIVQDGLDCKNLIKSKPHICYDSWTRRMCCASCATVYTGKADCLYGDRSDWCSSHIPSAHNAYLCYTNEHLCCGTCGRYAESHKEDANCHYGDKSDWCAVNIPSVVNKRMCYYGDNVNLCCGTCKAYKGTITGCEFGDKQNGCVRSQCGSYSQMTRNSCCETYLWRNLLDYFPAYIYFSNLQNVVLIQHWRDRRVLSNVETMGQGQKGDIKCGDKWIRDRRVISNVETNKSGTEGCYQMWRQWVRDRRVISNVGTNGQGTQEYVY
ncbi:hypothetical protein ACJMK2_025755 [Sinanodonta woodiana]|uniref:Peptidase M12B domain-containing protein n=1 Tax=Sinanodonta woodiana TaxID=1069815 RepID=A0ABD3XHH6_SINWO